VKNPNGAPHLPRVQIPANTRVTESLLKAIQTTWNVRAVVLDYLQSEEGYWRCAVLELLPGKAPSALRPMNIHQIEDDSPTAKELPFLAFLATRPPVPCRMWAGSMKPSIGWRELQESGSARFSKSSSSTLGLGSHLYGYPCGADDPTGLKRPASPAPTNSQSRHISQNSVQDIFPRC
jgi:hypothetical protein